MKDDIKILDEKHLWDSEKKTKFFGSGEWVLEPDFLKFEYKGYEGCVRRTILKELYAKEETYFGGYLCGYVNIPYGHPLFKKEDIPIDCHGGITFNQAESGLWIGFDCSHVGDYVPTMEQMRNTIPELIELKKNWPIPEGMEDHFLFNSTYRNFDYCIQECKVIINQLIDAQTDPKAKKE